MICEGEVRYGRKETEGNGHPVVPKPEIRPTLSVWMPRPSLGFSRRYGEVEKRDQGVLVWKSLGLDLGSGGQDCHDSKTSLIQQKVSKKLHELGDL